MFTLYPGIRDTVAFRSPPSGTRIVEKPVVVAPIIVWTPTAPIEPVILVQQ